MLAVFVNNLVYKLEANPDGSLDPSIVRSLLTSVGAESQLDSVASYDLVLAVVVAHFRRQTEEPEELRIQEVLRNLLMAKALGRGQGRRHALRKSIVELRSCDHFLVPFVFRLTMMFDVQLCVLFCFSQLKLLNFSYHRGI